MTHHSTSDRGLGSGHSWAGPAQSGSAARLPGRLAYVVASRQAGGLLAPALTLRIIGLVVVLTVLLQLEAAPFAIAACLPAVAICMLRARTAPAPVATDRTRREAETDSPRRRRIRWIVVTWIDLLSTLVVVALAGWTTVGLPATSRYLAVGAAAMLHAVAATRLCLDPRWYRPDPRPRRLSRWLRSLAGPLGVVACQALVLPAPWGPGERTIVVFLTLLPLANVALTQDQDLTVGRVVQLIRTEAQDGRQAVLDELHGTLSANLRLLEQASHPLRTSSPRLYELAVGANSRLRETLTLADPQVDSSSQPQTLSALVRTLTMAVGASGELTIHLDRLADADRDLIRLVLNDLLSTLLAGGANRVGATVELSHDSLRVTVTGDGRGRRVDHRLAPLRERLAAVGGTVSDRRDVDGVVGGTGADASLQRYVAAWPASAGTD